MPGRRLEAESDVRDTVTGAQPYPGLRADRSPARGGDRPESARPPVRPLRPADTDAGQRARARAAGGVAEHQALVNHGRLADSLQRPRQAVVGLQRVHPRAVSAEDGGPISVDHGEVGSCSETMAWDQTLDSFAKRQCQRLWSMLSRSIVNPNNFEVAVIKAGQVNNVTNKCRHKQGDGNRLYFYFCRLHHMNVLQKR
jgi:hypothetical protein